MTTEGLVGRLQRIYAAVGQVVEGDLSKFPATVIVSDSLFGIHQDFLGGLSEPQIENLAHSVIHNIANFPDHIRRHAPRQARGGIDSLIRESTALSIVRDLSNNDKHGYPPRDGGLSGLAPRLREITRALRLSTGSQQGSRSMVFLTPQGLVHRSTGGGTAAVVITGWIEDADGGNVGDLYETELAALDTCELLAARIAR